MTDNQTPSDDDVVAQSVAAYSDHLAAYTRDNADKVARQVAFFASQLQPGSRVLDAGCGPGRDLARFTDAGLTAIGVDLNPDFVAAASTHGLALRGDLRDLPFAEGTFDAVWACASLVHLPTDQAATALAELARVTRPGGLLLASVKHGGTTGWAETPHGRRWFQHWDRGEFLDTVHQSGWQPTGCSYDEVFVNVHATRA